MKRVFCILLLLCLSPSPSLAKEPFKNRFKESVIELYLVSPDGLNQIPSQDQPIQGKALGTFQGYSYAEGSLSELFIKETNFLSLLKELGAQGKFIKTGDQERLIVIKPDGKEVSKTVKWLTEDSTMVSVSKVTKAKIRSYNYVHLEKAIDHIPKRTGHFQKLTYPGRTILLLATK